MHGDDLVNTRHNARRIAPVRQIEQHIPAKDERDLDPRPPLRAQLAQSINGVRRPWPLDLQREQGKAIVVGERAHQHRYPMNSWRHLVAKLMRRDPSRNKPDAIEPQPSIGFLCKDEMPDVRRIKCPAQNTVALTAWHPEPLFIKRNTLRLSARAVPAPTNLRTAQMAG